MYNKKKQQEKKKKNRTLNHLSRFGVQVQVFCSRTQEPLADPQRGQNQLLLRTL